MKLTKDEEVLILAKRAKEDEDKPKKRGFLKHDLYFLDQRYPEVKIDLTDIVKENGWFLTTGHINTIIEQCKSQLYAGIKAPKGTPFDCYISKGREEWYDADGIGIEDYSADWAKKNLENISQV